MLERLIVTQIVAHRPLELGHGREEAIVRGAAPPGYARRSCAMPTCYTTGMLLNRG
jgi:hypothetical protein